MSALLPSGERGVGATLAAHGVYPKRRDLARMSEWQRLVDSGLPSGEAFARVACDPVLGLGRWRGGACPAPGEVAGAMGRFLARVSPAHARRSHDECVARAASVAPRVMDRVASFALEPMDPEAVEANRLALASSRTVLEAVGVLGGKGGTTVNVSALAQASADGSHDLAARIAADPVASRKYREMLDALDAAGATQRDAEVK